MSALPRPDLPPGTHRDLVTELHDLHHRAGWPSLRTLAAETGVSHTTVSKTFSQPALPSWGTLELLVEAMDGDTTHFHDLWLAASTPTDDTPTPTPRIAGRHTELETVRRHLETGTGLLLVTGEAGIGKTTLVRAAAASSEVVIARGDCLPLSSEVPLLPVVDLLRAARRALPDRFDDALAQVPPSLREHIAHLVPDLELDIVEGGVVATDDQLARVRQFVAVTEMTEAMADVASWRVLVEDLHWADRTSLDWLEHHLSGEPEAPLVGTWRTSDPDVSAATSEWLARVRRRDNVQIVRLAPLSAEETADQVRLLTPSADDERLARIHARSCGHPLFSEHLARAADDTHDLPQELASFLDHRLDRVPDRARAVAGAMGVADRWLPVVVLERATGLAPRVVRRGLHDLRSAHLVSTSSTDEVALAHPLLAEAVRRRLLPGESRSLHGALAQALTESTDTAPGELALHWQAADRPDQELACRVAAARQARTRLAFGNELASWLRALELCDATDSPPDPPIWVMLRDGMRAAIEVADLDVASRLAQRALALEVPDEARVQLLQRAGEVLYEVGELAGGMRLIDEARDLLLRLPPMSDLVDVVVSRFWTLAQAGRTEQAVLDAEVAMSHFAALDDARLGALRYSRDQMERLRAGDFAGALEVNEAHARSTEPGDLTSQLIVAVNSTDALLGMGASSERVLEAAGPALLASAQWGLDSTWIGSLLRTNVSWACLRAGEVTAAASVLEASTREDPDLRTWLPHQAMAAVEVRRGRVDQGLARSRAAQRQAMSHDLFWAQGAVWDADTMLWAGDARAAVRLLEEALTLVAGSDDVRVAGELITCLARATADELRPTIDDARLRAARDTVTAWRSRVTDDPFDAAGAEVSSRALRHQWEGELARIVDEVDAARWLRAAHEWDRLHRPHDAAYCRWRAAQVALRDGEATHAHRLLRRAAADAREHVPLTQAIADTASGART